MGWDLEGTGHDVMDIIHSICADAHRKPHLGQAVCLPTVEELPLHRTVQQSPCAKPTASLNASHPFIS
jgi:hypothetical protein